MKHFSKSGFPDGFLHLYLSVTGITGRWKDQFRVKQQVSNTLLVITSYRHRLKTVKKVLLLKWIFIFNREELALGRVRLCILFVSEWGKHQVVASGQRFGLFYFIKVSLSAPACQDRHVGVTPTTCSSPGPVVNWDSTPTHWNTGEKYLLGWC